MGQIIVNGDVFGEPNETITVTPVYTEGIKVATITINGVDHDIYIPANGGNNE